MSNGSISSDPPFLYFKKNILKAVNLIQVSRALAGSRGLDNHDFSTSSDVHSNSV